MKKIKKLRIMLALLILNDKNKGNYNIRKIISIDKVSTIVTRTIIMKKCAVIIIIKLSKLQGTRIFPSSSRYL